MANYDKICKYVWVIETIARRKKITFKELDEKWQSNVEMSGGLPLSKRTFNNWRYAIEDIFNLDIVNENCGEYRYYIENIESLNDGGVCSWLYNTYSVSNALVGSQSIKDRILLEYVSSGQEHLLPIMEAMKENKVINITYHSYGKDADNNFDVQPYCLKLFRQRWYLVARSTYPYYYEKGPRIYSLDRIRYLQTKDEKFKMPKDWNADEYFEGCFGIIAIRYIPIETVKLKVSAGQANYIRNLKMHKTQQEIERNDDYSIFSYRIRPQFDFMQEILLNGDSMEVLEPAWLRNEIAETIERMLNNYK